MWSTADQLVALFWLALRQALKKNEGIERHDGVVLLPIASGIVAKLTLREYTAESEIKACLLRDPSEYMLTKKLYTHTTKTDRYESQVGFEVPFGLYLSGAGVAVDIEFDSSPFFADPQLFQISTAGLDAVIADEEQQEADYSY